MKVELLILVDNSSTSDELRCEHGLSILMASADKRVLLDAGPCAQTLLHNAESLGVQLRELSAAIVSHGHMDHTGGLEAVATEQPGLDIYAHPGAFSRRWAVKPGQPLREISCPHSLRKLSEIGAVFHPVHAPEMLADWLVLSGPIGGPMNEPEAFVVRKDSEMVADRFEDELFCLIRSDRGWLVVTGCCHRGLKNTLRAAKFLAHDEPIAAVVGGLHLGSATDDELQAAIEVLESYGSPELYICHCTGKDATKQLRERFGEKVHAIAAGSRIVF